MKSRKFLYAPALLAMFALPAFAQTDTGPATTGPSAQPPATYPNADPNEYQRNVDQQDRIENGLKSGQVTTGGAAQLEKGEDHIDKMESHDEKTGMTPQESQNLERAQNRESQQIYDDKHNAATGNPDTASSQRMQADVQRDANQQTRIQQGVNSGSVTAGEAAKLENGQAADSRAQARAGANGNVSAKEQARLQRKQNRQSNRIHRKKHNNRTANTAG